MSSAAKQTRLTNNKENITFDLSYEFDYEATLEEFKQIYLEINLMKAENSEEPISTIILDFCICFGPTHHALKFKTNGGRHTIGLLQYNLNFEEL
mmetsp:Transcript_2956/g.3630  ORF Transcript_2956/g.3630 Transcript_2956/m.3630 type:complete len:95 (-) Transcript_2956:14-298(-)